MAKHIVLSDGEWKLMKLLWENHPMTLGDMVEAMQDDTAWSKGTIFTMLRRVYLSLLMLRLYRMH